MTDWFINWLIDQGGSGVSTGIVYIELREYMDMKWLMGSFGVFTGIMYIESGELFGEPTGWNVSPLSP